MTDEIGDLLKSLYEKNVDYHNVKERVVWLAGVVYLTFSTALIGWSLQSDISIPCELEKPVLVALSAIFALTVAFIIRQTREKVHSSVIMDQHFALMRKLPSRRTRAGLEKANTYSYKKWKAFWRFICMGWSGHLILGVAYVFFLAQLTIIGEIQILPWVWITGPAVAISLPLIVSWGYRIKECRKLKKKLRVKRCRELKKKLRNIRN